MDKGYAKDLKKLCPRWYKAVGKGCPGGVQSMPKLLDCFCSCEKMGFAGFCFKLYVCRKMYDLCMIFWLLALL